MKIAVIGTGYVGLVAGACFADTGNDVFCVDKNEAKIKDLLGGKIPIYEPGLDTIVERAVSQDRLHFTTSTAEAVKNSEIIFMAVNTPSMENGEPNLSFLQSAAEEVARAMDGYRLIVNKSTVPIGAHGLVAGWMKKHTQHPFDVASNPEFLKEGTAIEDFLKPDRVIIGTDKEEVFEKMARLYAPFVRQGNPILKMDPISAEMAKYACNAFLATRISFMNELSVLCEKVGGNVDSVRKGMASDVRIGRHFLYPGVGYGGSCFPKDIKALVDTAKKNEVPLAIVNAAEDANQRQKRHMFTKIKNYFQTRGGLNGKSIAIWGLAFKPNTDDIREAPALVVINELINEGAQVRAFDPVAADNVREVFEDRIVYGKKSYDVLEGADALVVLTEWNEFREPDFGRMKALMKQPIVFDGRNIFDPKAMRAKGFKYESIGRL